MLQTRSLQSKFQNPEPKNPKSRQQNIMEHLRTLQGEQHKYSAYMVDREMQREQMVQGAIAGRIITPNVSSRLKIEQVRKSDSAYQHVLPNG